MQQWGFCRQQQKVQFIGDSIVPPDVGDLVLGLYPGLHFGFSHPHSQHMPPGNVFQTCKKGRPVSPSVTHHCIHQERDSFPQHMVVFCRYFGPAEESVELVQSSHLVKEERGDGGQRYLVSPDLPVFQVRLVCKKESRYRSSIREFHLKGGRKRDLFTFESRSSFQRSTLATVFRSLRSIITMQPRL